jgi:hypothetical protein
MEASFGVRYMEAIVYSKLQVYGDLLLKGSSISGSRPRCSTR